MRYYTEKPNGAFSTRRYTYTCDHPLYSKCTLIKVEDKGLAIVQRRFNAKLKIFWYGPIESWLADLIVAQPGFEAYFEKNSGRENDGLYPTVSVRQVMWALRMKPLRKDEWNSQELQLL